MKADINTLKESVKTLAHRYGCAVEDFTDPFEDEEPPCLTVLAAPKKLHEKLAELSVAFYGTDVTAPLFGDCDIFVASRPFLTAVNAGRYAAAMAR